VPTSSRISERAAAAVLGELGLAREQARQLLRTGAAGPGTVASGIRWYDEARVVELRDRPRLDDEALGRVFPDGVYVARLTRDREVDLARSWDDRAAMVARQPALSAMTASLLVGVPAAARGGVPWLATVSGFVVLAATATGYRHTGGATVFDLAPPGEWGETIERRWFLTGPGRHWSHWRPSPVDRPGLTED
jgi:hypothetical protein